MHCFQQQFTCLLCFTRMKVLVKWTLEVARLGGGGSTTWQTTDWGPRAHPKVYTLFYTPAHHQTKNELFHNLQTLQGCNYILCVGGYDIFHRS